MIQLVFVSLLTIYASLASSHALVGTTNAGYSRSRSTEAAGSVTLFESWITTTFRRLATSPSTHHYFSNVRKLGETGDDNATGGGSTGGAMRGTALKPAFYSTSPDPLTGSSNTVTLTLGGPSDTASGLASGGSGDKVKIVAASDDCSGSAGVGLPATMDVAPIAPVGDADAANLTEVESTIVFTTAGIYKVRDSQCFCSFFSSCFSSSN